MRVAQCDQAHHHQGQLSGKAVLATGLAAFAVYLEVVPAADGETPTLFRVLLCAFQAAMVAVLLVNMVQAVEPMASSEKMPGRRLRPWAARYLDHDMFDKTHYLALSVTLVWGGVVAVAATQLPFGSEPGWSVAITCLVVLGLSLATVSPGVALVGAWGVLWLVPAGLALVLRSVFDALLALTNKLSLAGRRMTREIDDHVGGVEDRHACWVLLQLLPLLPLLVVSLPVRLLYFVVWLVHLWMAIFARIADLVLYPVSPFRLLPILGDYGSVAWRMGRLGMDIEQRAMTALLHERIAAMQEEEGSLFRSGVIPPHPYSHLDYPAYPNQRPVRVPRLGCIAILPQDEGEKRDRALFVNRDLVFRGVKAEGGGSSGTDMSGVNGSPNLPDSSAGPAAIC